MAIREFLDQHNRKALDWLNEDTGSGRPRSGRRSQGGAPALSSAPSDPEMRRSGAQ